MSFFPNALENLIDQFAALPGVGRKSAQRLAFHVLSLPEEEALKFAAAIVDAKKNIHCCSICQNLTDQETCTICASPKRGRYPDPGAGQACGCRRDHGGHHGHQPRHGR